MRLAVANIAGMHMDAAQIVKALKGTNATARFFGVKAPSVSKWLKVGAVPDERLIPVAARLESTTEGAFSRRTQWPDRYEEIWPEMASASAIQSVAPSAAGEGAHV